MIETRSLEQTLIHKLVMNRMTDNTESSSIVAWSDERDKLIEWYNSQRADEPYYTIGENSFPAKGDFPAQYSDQHKYYKSFKEGGPLEWYNPIEGFDQINRYGQGIQTEWVDTEKLPQIKTYYLYI